MLEIRQRLLAVASRFGLPVDACEDIAHDALTRLLAANEKGRPPADPTAFAVRAAVNLALDRLRSQRRRFTLLRRAPLVTVNVTAEETADRPAEIERLYASIARLPERQAAVVVLRKLVELDYAEIALLMGTSEENCRSLCRHGLTKLRELMQPLESRPAERKVAGAT